MSEEGNVDEETKTTEWKQDEYGTWQCQLDDYPLADLPRIHVFEVDGGLFWVANAERSQLITDPFAGDTLQYGDLASALKSGTKLVRLQLAHRHAVKREWDDLDQRAPLVSLGRVGVFGSRTNGRNKVEARGPESAFDFVIDDRNVWDTICMKSPVRLFRLVAANVVKAAKRIEREGIECAPLEQWR